MCACPGSLGWIGQPDVPRQAAGKALALVYSWLRVPSGYWTGIWGSKMDKEWGWGKWLQYLGDQNGASR